MEDCERKDHSQENKLICPATLLDVTSLLQQTNEDLGTWDMTTGLENASQSQCGQKGTWEHRAHVRGGNPQGTDLVHQYPGRWIS